MIAHGVRHGRTLDGTARWFASIGFREPDRQAQLSSVVEIGSGVAVLAGALTPVSTAAVVGTMGVAFRTVHRPNGYFVINEGWEYVGLLAVAAVALSSLGAGRVSVDRLIKLDQVGTSTGRAAFTATLGIVGTAVQLRAFWKQPTGPVGAAG